MPSPSLLWCVRLLAVLCVLACLVKPDRVSEAVGTLLLCSPRPKAKDHGRSRVTEPLAGGRGKQFFF